MAENLIYVWAGTDGLCTSSPFCLKAVNAAKYKKIPHKLKYVGARFPQWAKRGKLPVVDFNGRKIEDSTNILHALDEIAPDSKLYPDDPMLRADVFLLEDWADEALVQFGIYYRFLRNHNYDRFAKQAFGKAPRLIQLLIRRSLQGATRKFFDLHGMAHLSDQERAEIFDRHLWALEQRIQKNSFLVTHIPTAADFAIHAMLKVALASEIVELAPIIRQHKTLIDWMERMDKLVQ